MYRLKLSLRYMAVRPITWITVLGMSMGVAMLVIVPSVMTGFSEEFRKKVRGTLSDMTVESRAALSLDEQSAGLESALAELAQIAHVSPYIENIVIVDDPLIKDYTMMKGVDPAKERATSDFETYIKPYGEMLKEANDYDDLCEGVSRLVGLFEETCVKHGVKSLSPTLEKLQAAMEDNRPAEANAREALREFRRFLEEKMPDAERDAFTEAEVFETFERVLLYASKKVEIDQEVLALGEAAPGDDPFDARALPEPLRRRAMVESKIAWDQRSLALEEKGKPPLGEWDGEPLPGIVVGVYLLRAYRASGVTIGSRIKLVTASDEKEVKQGEFVITGCFQTGVWDTDRRFMYGGLKPTQEFFGLPGTLSGISLKLTDFGLAEQTKAELNGLLVKRGLGRSLFVQTWQEKNKSLLQAVKMEKALIRLILFLFMVLVGINIFTGLTTLVVEKTKEIGILKALGATRRGVRGVFLFQGLFIGAFSTVVGLILGLLVTHNINELADRLEDITGVHPFPKDVYYLDRIPAVIDAADLAVVIGVTLAISFAAAQIPAIRAGRRDPVQAMRNG